MKLTKVTKHIDCTLVLLSYQVKFSRKIGKISRFWRSGCLVPQQNHSAENAALTAIFFADIITE